MLLGALFEALVAARANFCEIEKRYAGDQVTVGALLQDWW